MELSTQPVTALPLQPSPAPPPLPEPQRQPLSNGVELVQLDLPQAPVLCLDFWCRAGSATERQQESGLAHFLEHMVFKGSTSLAAGEFDRRVEALGGNSNAATGFDDVHYHVLIPPPAAAEALELLLELVLQPRLDADDFAMERQVVLEELAQSEDQPEEVAFQELLRRACPDHAYGLPILGRREALEAHDPEAMAAFHATHYRADRCCLSLAGPLQELQLLPRLEASALARLPAGGGPWQPEPLRLQAGECTLELPRLEAARLLMAWQLPAAANQDAVVGGDLLTTLMAEGRRSRLVQRLREQLRLVESIDLDLNVLEAGSLVLLEAVCDPGHLDQVQSEVQQVWRELMETPPPEAELERAKRLVGNGYRFGLEAAGSVAALVGNSSLWGRRHNLQAPLDWMDRWDSARLSRELIPLLDPQRAFCLRAVPT
jgi:predicted Zn-dependent peptidase